MKSYTIVIIFFLLNIIIFSQSSSWFNNGPDGGSVNCVSVSNSNPNILYIGTKQGIYKSENKGISWIKTSFRAYEVSCIEVSPNSSNIVIAGTKGQGIWRTTNGGIDWMFAGLNNITINCIAIDPNNTNNIYCGNGDWFTYGGCGIFKSSNGGESFDAIIEWAAEGQARLAKVNSILIDPENSDNLYVAGATKGSSFGAFLYSIDGGANWINKKITTSSSEGIINIAVIKDSIGQKVTYAMERPAYDPWGYPSFYKSSDLGDNWEPVDGPYSSNYEPNLFMIDPNNSNDIYIGARSYATQILVYKTDQDMWDVIPRTGLPSSWSTCIGVSSEITPTIYLGNYYGGIYNFTTGVSSQWSQIVNGINATYITDIAVHPSSPDLAYACIKDENRLFKTVDSGENWSRITGSSPNLIAVDPQNSSIIYAAESDQDGSNYYIYKSSNSGINWQQIKFIGCSGTDCSTKLTDILIHPTNSQKILVSTRIEWFTGYNAGPRGFGTVARTTDGGNTWDELLSVSSTALAIDPNNPDIIYSGKERSGQIWKIENAWGLANTTEITPSGIDNITDIELDNSSNVYVATESGLWRYTAGNWTKLTLPSAVITSIDIDRNITPNIIYAATGDNGAFISNDGGSSWNIWNDGLKNLSITKLKIGGSKVWVGTEYGGVWCRNTAQSISPQYITHNTGDYRISIFQDGSFGHLSSLNTIGEGCKYNNNVDALFASGLIFGTQSAGFVNGNQPSFQIVNELANTEPINEVNSSDPELDQISQTAYNDNSAIIPYEVSVRQKAFSDTGDEFVILEFGFTPVFSSLDNFYAGIFADWDVGGGDGYSKNLGGYDQSRNLAYQYIIDGSPDPCYYGIVALNGMAGSKITTEGGAMRETGLQRISTFENETISEIGDYRMWIGSGPFNLTQNSSISIYFAFVAGTDLENLKTNADAAVQKYQYIITDVQDAKDLPLQFHLSQNYPNPFNPATTIKYTIPKQSNVTLKLFDVLGRDVKTLVNGNQPRGNYEIKIDASELASGIYFYLLKAEEFFEIKKMVLLK